MAGVLGIFLVVVAQFALLAMAQIQTSSVTLVPGGNGQLPCYVIGLEEPMGTRLNVSWPAGRGATYEVEIPSAGPYFEYHGWGFPERCVGFEDMSPEEISANVQTHAHVEVAVNRQDIEPSQICVYAFPGAEVLRRCAPWVFEYPEGLLKPGIYVVTLRQPLFNQDFYCECFGPTGCQTEGNFFTSTVTILYADQ